MWEGLTKKWVKKNQKKIFCRVPALALGKEVLCRVPGSGTRQRRDLYRVQGLGTRQRLSLPSARADTRQRIFFLIWRRGQARPSSAIFLPSATLCRVLHSAKRAFAECRPLPSAGHSVALGKATLCRVLDFAECHPVRHSAKSGFAECPIFGTRQSWRHSANLRSPVVHICLLHAVLQYFLKKRCESCKIIEVERGSTKRGSIRGEGTKGKTIFCYNSS